MELTYKRQGDYLIPDLELPEEPNIGKYGMLRRTYLQQNKKVIFGAMQMKETLKDHLEEVDRQANEMMERLIKQMAKEQGVTEELKARDQMAWVQQMNNIRSSAEEIVLSELIYR